jgi:hypothetical protein
MTRLAGLLALLALGLAAGSANAARANPLAVLAVPCGELGKDAAGFQVELLSGDTSNARAADDSLDPNDTEVTIAGAGRVGGYTLFYGDPSYSALRRGKGPIEIGTSIDLFKTPKQAQAYEAKSLRDVRRVRGLSLGGVVVERSSTFRVSKLGPGATGLHIVHRIGSKRVYGTYVDFQIDRILCEATVTRADAVNADAQALRIARLLAGRIVAYANNKLKSTPVRLPRALGTRRLPKGAPDLEAMALTPKDLKLKATVVDQGYEPNDNAIVAYSRRFRAAPSVGLDLLSNDALLVRTKREAAGRLVLLRAVFTGPESAATIAADFVSAAAVKRSRPTIDGVRNLGAGDESFAVSASLTAQSRRIHVVLAYVRRGRVVGTLVLAGPKPSAVAISRVTRLAHALDKRIQAVLTPGLIA